MVEYRWIKTFLILTGLQFTGASFFIRLGGDVSLPCNNLIPDQNKCDSTTWLFSGSRNSAAVELINLGKIKQNIQPKSDRLSVTENCSLVIKKVTAEDVGRYSCRQFISGQQQGGDAQVDLSVVNITEHKDTDKVTLRCSVWTHGRCRHTVKWLYEGKDVENNSPNVKTSQSPCNATVIFLSSHYSSWYTLFKCEVRDGNNNQQFTFTLQPPGEKPGHGTITATTATTQLSVTNSIKAGLTTTASTTNSDSTKLEDWLWLFIVVASGLVAVLILVVIGWKRTKGNKSGMNNKELTSKPAVSHSGPETSHNMELTSKPAVSQSPPETSHNMADPEVGVSYASISFKKKTKSKAEVCTKNDDDEGDSVTYTTVKASSTDPSSLYASIK